MKNNKIFKYGFIITGIVSTAVSILSTLIFLLLLVFIIDTDFIEINQYQVLSTYNDLNNNIVYVNDDNVYINNNYYNLNCTIFWLDDKNILFYKDRKIYLMDESKNITFITDKYLYTYHYSIYYYNSYIYHYESNPEKKYFKLDCTLQNDIEIDEYEYYHNRDGSAYTINDSDLDYGIIILDNNTKEKKIISHDEIYKNSILSNFKNANISYSKYYVYNNEIYLKYFLSNTYSVILKYDYENEKLLMYDYKKIYYMEHDWVNIFFSNSFIDERIHFLMKWCEQ